MGDERVYLQSAACFHRIHARYIAQRECRCIERGWTSSEGKMDDLNVNSNNNGEFCNAQYRHFAAPYGGTDFSKLDIFRIASRTSLPRVSLFKG
jgi:hypothetical protein